MVSRIRSARRWPVLLVVVVLVVSACSSGATVTDTTIALDEPRDPVDTVRLVLESVDGGLFEQAAALTDSNHAALLTLVEGADVTEVAEAIRSGGQAVTANFWSGFAQSLPEGFAPDTVGLTAGDEVAQGDKRFAPVMIDWDDGSASQMILRREEDRWIVDMMATFGPILAERLIPPVENVLTSANPDAATVLGHLGDTAESLRYAVASSEMTPDTRQSVLALLERVTRTGS